VLLTDSFIDETGRVTRTITRHIPW